MDNKPTEGDLIEEELNGSNNAGTDDTEDDSDTDIVNDTDAESDDESNDAIDTENEDSVFRLTSGTWDLADATILSDICGWNYPLTNAFGMDGLFLSFST